MEFGLSEIAIEKLRQVFIDYPVIEEVIIYGSRAKGNFEQGSDIDLTLKGNQLSVQIMNKISQDIDDLNLPYIIDLSIFDHIDNHDLIDHINRAGKVFYRKT